MQLALGIGTAAALLHRIPPLVDLAPMAPLDEFAHGDAHLAHRVVVAQLVLVKDREHSEHGTNASRR
jgi:hypothetical protein